MHAADVACRHLGGLERRRLVTAHLERLELMRHHHPVGRDVLTTGPAECQLLTAVDLQLSGQVGRGRCRGRDMGVAGSRCFVRACGPCSASRLGNRLSDSMLKMVGKPPCCHPEHLDGMC